MSSANRPSSPKRIAPRLPSATARRTPSSRYSLQGLSVTGSRGAFSSDMANSVHADRFRSWLHLTGLRRPQTRSRHRISAEPRGRPGRATLTCVGGCAVTVAVLPDSALRARRGVEAQALASPLEDTGRPAPMKDARLLERSDATKKPKTCHCRTIKGHRKRLRERFVKSGLAGFAEHEVVELLLTLAIPRADVKQPAKELLARFGNLRGVLDAPLPELRAVDGIGEVAAGGVAFGPRCRGALLAARVRRRRRAAERHEDQRLLAHEDRRSEARGVRGSVLGLRPSVAARRRGNAARRHNRPRRGLPPPRRGSGAQAPSGRAGAGAQPPERQRAAKRAGQAAHTAPSCSQPRPSACAWWTTWLSRPTRRSASSRQGCCEGGWPAFSDANQNPWSVNAPWSGSGRADRLLLYRVLGGLGSADRATLWFGVQGPEAAEQRSLTDPYGGRTQGGRTVHGRRRVQDESSEAADGERVWPPVS